jgi:hypothetical protein
MKVNISVDCRLKKCRQTVEYWDSTKAGDTNGPAKLYKRRISREVAVSHREPPGLYFFV